jgi:hypothetical protein
MTVWPKSAAGDSPGGDYHRRRQTHWLSIAMYHVAQQLLRPDLTAHELLKTTMALAKVTSGSFVTRIAIPAIAFMAPNPMLARKTPPRERPCS